MRGRSATDPRAAPPAPATRTPRGCRPAPKTRCPPPTGNPAAPGNKAPPATPCPPARAARPAPSPSPTAGLLRTRPGPWLRGARNFESDVSHGPSSSPSPSRLRAAGPGAASRRASRLPGIPAVAFWCRTARASSGPCARTVTVSRPIGRDQAPPLRTTYRQNASPPRTGSSSLYSTVIFWTGPRGAGERQTYPTYVTFSPASGRSSESLRCTGIVGLPSVVTLNSVIRNGGSPTAKTGKLIPNSSRGEAGSWASSNRHRISATSQLSACAPAPVASLGTSAATAGRISTSTTAD